MDVDFEGAERQFTLVVEKYKAPSTLWFESVEAELGPDGRELTRQILQGHVDSRGRGDIGPALVTADGAILTHRRLSKKTLQTMFGEISIERIGYSLPDYPAVFPLDAVLNLPASSFSAGIQRFLARRASVSSFEEVLDLIREVTGVAIGKPQALDLNSDRKMYTTAEILGAQGFPDFWCSVHFCVHYGAFRPLAAML